MGTVVNTRPGYWDIDRCSWVGVEPMYVMPPARAGEHPHDRVPDGSGAAVSLPAPRDERAGSTDQAVEGTPSPDPAS